MHKACITVREAGPRVTDRVYASLSARRVHVSQIGFMHHKTSKDFQRVQPVAAQICFLHPPFLPLQHPSIDPPPPLSFSQFTKGVLRLKRAHINLIFIAEGLLNPQSSASASRKQMRWSVKPCHL